MILKDTLREIVQRQKEAMERFNLKTGIILTLKQKDDLGSIKVIPAWEWMLNKS